MYKKVFISFWIIASFVFHSHVSADDSFSFNHNGSVINGSIKYAVIGRYKAAFKNFDGIIQFDKTNNLINSVVLNIETKSIKSKRKNLDNIVISKRILDADQYPEISFVSSKISRKEGIYHVDGILNLHGVQKKISFLFDFAPPVMDNEGKEYLTAKGRWEINRKDYDIIWHKHLDKGGILVGNTFTVDWKIKAYQK